MPYFSTNPIGFYEVKEHAPHGAVPITQERKQELHAGELQGLLVSADEQGYPVLIAQPLPSVTAANLGARIDSAADAARQQLAGNALLAVEHERAAAQAEAFKAVGYQGEVPPMVAAWAVNGRSAEQAARDILAKATQYNQTIEQVRSLRLAGKEQVRALISAGNTDQAVAITDSTLISLNALRNNAPDAG